MTVLAEQLSTDRETEERLAALWCERELTFRRVRTNDTERARHHFHRGFETARRRWEEFDPDAEPNPPHWAVLKMQRTGLTPPETVMVLQNAKSSPDAQPQARQIDVSTSEIQSMPADRRNGPQSALTANVGLVARRRESVALTDCGQHCDTANQQGANTR